MIFLPCKLAFCHHYTCLLFAQSGSVNKVHLPWYIFTIAQPWHHFSQAHSQLHCYCCVLQNLGSQPQWKFKSAWYLARCDSTIVLEMSRRPEPIIPPFIEANGSEVNSLLCWLEAGAQDFLQLFIHEVLRLRGKNIWSVSHNRSIIGWMLCKISSINILNFQYPLPAEPKDTSAHTYMILNLTLMELTLEKTYIFYIVLGYCGNTIVFNVLTVSYSLSCKSRSLYLN